MRILLKFGFRGLNLHSIEANINPQNENSKGVLEKIGFQKEAYFRENYYYKEKFLDSEIYCLLENDLK
jgi:ribosomal-protein-alanine N-acetyltransferase